MTPTQFDPVWITSDHQLVQCCKRLQNASRIAVDTEFMRTNTFYPKAALFQVYGDGFGSDDSDEKGRCWLIDPLTISDFTPFVEVLTDPGVLKIFHACSEDLEVFNSFLDCVPQPLVDTQIAAGLLAHGASLSYGALVESILGIRLEKGETRSDWLQRPLQSRQIQYAVQDVVYLLPLYEALMEELERMGREPWLREDCETLVANAKQPTDPDAFYLRIKSGWKLNRQELAVLRQLSLWRERRARERNVPRNHVIHEKVLWTLAKLQPQNLDALRRIEGMEMRKVKRFGSEVLKTVADARALAPADYPEALPGPLPVAQRNLMKALKQAATERAAELQMLPETLAKKADFDFIVRSGMNADPYRLPKRLLGWRQAVVGESLLAVAEEQAGGAAERAPEPEPSGATQ